MVKRTPTLADVIGWCRAAPQGTTLSAAAVADWLEPLTSDAPAEVTGHLPPEPTTWRERLWTVPEETRIGVRELAQAVGRTPSWVYRHTSTKSGLPLLPHRKLDGELIFVVGEVRTWIRSHEEVLRPGQIGHVTPALMLRQGGR